MQVEFKWHVGLTPACTIGQFVHHPASLLQGVLSMLAAANSAVTQRPLLLILACIQTQYLLAIVVCLNVWQHYSCRYAWDRMQAAWQHGQSWFCLTYCSCNSTCNGSLTMMCDHWQQNERPESRRQSSQWLPIAEISQHLVTAACSASCKHGCHSFASDWLLMHAAVKLRITGRHKCTNHRQAAASLVVPWVITHLDPVMNDAH